MVEFAPPAVHFLRSCVEGVGAVGERGEGGVGGGGMTYIL